MFKLVW